MSRSHESTDIQQTGITCTERSDVEVIAICEYLVLALISKCSRNHACKERFIGIPNLKFYGKTVEKRPQSWH